MNENKILIVDDEEEICMLLSSFLKSNGHQAVTANSVQQAKQVLAQGLPQMAILDVNLPDGLGFELIPLLRDKSDLKILIISARDGEKERELSKKHQVDGYLLKPFKRQEILNFVEKNAHL